MSVSIGLELMVKKEMNDIISSNFLNVVSRNDNEVLLKSSSYIMDVVADRDGVSIVYFDITQKPVKGYNVLLFLMNKRRKELDFAKEKPIINSYSNFIECEIHAIAEHLRKAGQDILSGSKDWMRTYSWPTVCLTDKNADII